MATFADHYAVPLFMIVFAAGLLILAHHNNDPDLKSFAIGVGGGGLTQLTSAIKQTTTNRISGSPVNIDQTGPTTDAGTPAK